MKPTESRKRYNDYPAYFKELFGERVQKLSIDGGFTCPNRDGKKGPVVVRFVIMRVLIRVIAGLCRGYPDRSGREGPFLPESISVRSIWLIFRLIRIPMLLWKSYGKSMRRRWLVPM